MTDWHSQQFAKELTARNSGLAACVASTLETDFKHLDEPWQMHRLAVDLYATHHDDAGILLALYKWMRPDDKARFRASLRSKDA